eukprot:TRINITY_DN1684_c0_g1_i1.p1 TRINITY_DN1684_c0_g1~~TRINITY_DN1684_c0_g1_i1.p1  ORF type:complete len:2137 (-),score=539.86 TRINITY_DN1684_c0_g1_i1:63-5960(-)
MTELHKYSRMITDYEDDGGMDIEPGEEEGIAVIVGDEEETQDKSGNYVVESSEEENDETENASALAGSDAMQLEEQNSLVDPTTIEAYWLQRQLSQFYPDADTCQEIATQVFEVLETASDRTLENKLVKILGYNVFDFIKMLAINRSSIVFCTQLKQAEDNHTREQIELRMSQDEDGARILSILKGETDIESSNLETRVRREAESFSRARRENREAEAMDIVDGEYSINDYLDLDELAFDQGGHLMSSKTINLPKGSFQTMHKGYEEYTIPPPPVPEWGKDEKLIPIEDIPRWTHAAFEGVKHLNRVQSRMYPTAYETNENFLLCAPTGAGKTNVAMLAMLQEINRHRDPETGNIDLSSFKIVYVAPMKSLVQEMAFNFGERLAAYGIQVAELSGDSSITKKQMDATQVIFTTPEKWDIITRKSGERVYTQLVKLLIIDEIHLLHDTRGPVLESVVARTIRQVESTKQMIRLVGLSATLPNYNDVAVFLRVKREQIHAMPNDMRPIPLEQTFIGLNMPKPFKRYQMMNRICYQKVIERAGRFQTLIFVHSRKETTKTAKVLRDMAFNNEAIGRFVKDGDVTREILLSEAENVKDSDLRDLLPYGFAIHHAGLCRDDRTLVEDLMADRHIQVLVSTATLAWGVNLPAQTVIIKGTQVYSSELGKWTELSHLDVMQMLGRAGRPGFDKKGDGIVITTRNELQYYLSLLNEQLPIESQFINTLADNLNAEIVLGTIQNVKEAVNWLSYTYLNVRMNRNPTLYGVSLEQKEEDPYLRKRRTDLIHTAASLLAKHNLIKYDRKSGFFQVTDFGRISSHYYVNHKSMATFNDHLKSTSSDIDILRTFSLSQEFKQVSVRSDEREELEQLLEKVPIPVKEGVAESSAKINVLLQAYISKLPMDGYSLVADLVYVTQSAGRLLRCLFEIALVRGWATVAEKCLEYCQMTEKRQWFTQTPLRQFNALPELILRKIEKRDLTIEKLYDLDSHEIGESIDFAKLGRKIHDIVHLFPKLELSATVQPVTRYLLRVDLTITPDFNFAPKYHKSGLAFWILVVDVDGQQILHHEMFILKARFASEEHDVQFTVPLSEPLPPQYFIKVISDRWIGSVSTMPISFRHLILPEKFPPHTGLLDLQPLPFAALKNPHFEGLYKDFKELNSIQTQTFSTLYTTDQNTLICAPTGSGKTLCAEFAILREFSKEKPGKIVFIAPKMSIAKQKLTLWRKRFTDTLGARVNITTGEWTADSPLLRSSQIIISVPEHWDMISRKWKQRKSVQNVALYIVDELHLIGGNEGPTLEIVVTRMRYISHQIQMKIEGHPGSRIVALATSLANSTEIADWLGVPPAALFNFHLNVRPVPLDIYMQGFNNPHFSARILQMHRPVLYSVSQHAGINPVIIFVPSRRIAKDIAKDLVIHSHNEGRSSYLHCNPEDIEALIADCGKTTKSLLLEGVGIFHEALTPHEKEVVYNLYMEGFIQILIVTQYMCWDIDASASLVIIMGVEYYEGKEHKHINYSVSNLLQMIGRSGRAGIDDGAKCIIYWHNSKKEFYKKFVFEPVPVESHLDHYLHDHINAEIVTKTIDNKQDVVDYITWTFYYRRLTRNPNYYNIKGASHKHISDHLSTLVEDTLEDLEESRCVTTDDMNVSYLNLGMIAFYYYVRYTTIELFNHLLNKNTGTKSLLEILSHADEFASLSIRRGEERILRKLAAHLPISISKPDYSSPATKVNILLQSQLTRRILTPDLADDLNYILNVTPRLVKAIVDVISSNGWLKPAIACMELSQMFVQAVWITDSFFRQLPHISNELGKKMEEENSEVESILDLPDIPENKREEYFSEFSEQQKNDIIIATNRYPNIGISFDMAEEVAAGSKVSLSLILERELEEKEKLGEVYAPHFPHEKAELWWFVLGDEQNNLHSIHRTAVNKPEAAAELKFQAPHEEGTYKYTLYVICDSYLGCDQEWDVEFTVSGTAMDVDE